MWVRRVVIHPSKCAPGSPASSPFHKPLPQSPIASVVEIDGACLVFPKVTEGVNSVGVVNSSGNSNEDGVRVTLSLRCEPRRVALQFQLNEVNTSEQGKKASVKTFDC
eukprot:1147582-Pelagomonas_calceolata.AAC.1